MQEQVDRREAERNPGPGKKATPVKQHPAPSISDRTGTRADDVVLIQDRHRDSDPPEKWRVIGAALENNGKTFRLCLILLVITLPTVLITAGTIVIVLMSQP